MDELNSEEKDVLGPVGSEMALVVSAIYTGVASLCGTNWDEIVPDHKINKP